MDGKSVLQGWGSHLWLPVVRSAWPDLTHWAVRVGRLGDRPEHFWTRCGLEIPTLEAIIVSAFMRERHPREVPAECRACRLAE